MNTTLDAVADLVAAQGMDPESAGAIAIYIADRCAGLSLASVHSSPCSSLRRDAYLVTRLGLSPRQVGAWLALIRGTRAARPPGGGPLRGGFPGMIEALATGQLDEAASRRFTRLARVAALGHAGDGCRTAGVRRQRRSPST